MIQSMITIQIYNNRGRLFKFKIINIVFKQENIRNKMRSNSFSGIQSNAMDETVKNYKMEGFLKINLLIR